MEEELKQENWEGGHEPALISAEELLYAILPMPTGPVQDPAVFVEDLRRYHEAGQGTDQGKLANALSELIISKRVDLAAVRLLLLDGGHPELMDTLNRLVDLIEPYIEEGGVEQ
jgi:hypothetical protein